MTDETGSTRVSTPDKTAHDVAIVVAYLEASMVPDPELAATYMAPGIEIVFTGARSFRHPREVTAFNAGRYAWVKKRMERLDAVPGDGTTTVYSLGTLYGAWPDGTQFAGNRYVDRFTVRDGLIVTMEVWNDSAERILSQRGITA
ncbi:nuclear transport factor 2 family protein [Methylobacterium sp. WL103]|uniref:nuclear transport factor 2 family protein n=1 Tax=Methylobacterium sp. WL103 TaxID=2603891 RepID=UPI0011C86534|nr:nuclear transport factor 2 family protein [Methylobacterium sp. WL103]TXN08266.1 nuclear transport factor 2 family protein [Methylobacterium sp. WL103]